MPGPRDWGFFFEQGTGILSGYWGLGSKLLGLVISVHWGAILQFPVVALLSHQARWLRIGA